MGGNHEWFKLGFSIWMLHYNHGSVFICGMDTNCRGKICEVCHPQPQWLNLKLRIVTFTISVPVSKVQKSEILLWVQIGDAFYLQSWAVYVNSININPGAFSVILHEHKKRSTDRQKYFKQLLRLTLNLLLIQCIQAILPRLLRKSWHR